MKSYERSYLAPYRRDTSGATLFVLLLVLAAPALVVALALGWRPPTDALIQAMARLGGNAERQAVAPPASPADWALADGWFYAYPPPQPGQAEVTGYAVTDADDVPFRTEYQRLGGPQYLGYPRSRRFSNDEAVLQVYQRGVLQFQGAERGVTVVRLLDELHTKGNDSEMALRWGIPEMELPVPSDAAPELAGNRLRWLLQDFPAFRSYLDAAPDATEQLGWPTSRVRDRGDSYVLRFQSGALQQWKNETPWAKAGDVTAANIGDIAITLGIFPSDALEPEAAQPPAPAAPLPDVWRARPQPPPRPVPRLPS